MYTPPSMAVTDEAEARAMVEAQGSGWLVTVADGVPAATLVPTWNYLAVHLSGPVRVHHDPEWLRDVVTRLTDRHEQQRPDPWAVGDAPEEYVDSMLRAIVGIELLVERVDAKVKASQNRSEADRRGVLDGLAATDSPGAQALASIMRRHLGAADE